LGRRFLLSFTQSRGRLDYVILEYNCASLWENNKLGLRVGREDDKITSNGSAYLGAYRNKITVIIVFLSLTGYIPLVSKS